ncbi:hypothetical protein COC42_08035 [Sphingomonas spermidinifaciens]|uniref:Uncharacterized protein n=1 Tax=Sphingomonas spermidinifaciens TaxID=1141889 RepID=A0A2A4B991_9SPHN|nr:hypothetical protein COC42_08035 [Sphingomonas spermidinifaciens]
MACKTLNQEGTGIRIENLLALLASVGGQQCLLPILAMLGGEGRPLKDVGMVQAKTEDGNVYFFGDASNRLLVESELSLISLAFGAARDCGAPVSMEMIHAEMQHVASSIGDDEALFRLDLPESHAVDSPLNWAAHFSPMFVEACDLYRLPPMERAAAFGFALQRAIIEGKDAIDPMIAARIILSCAMRTSKIDPHRLAAARRD